MIDAELFVIIFLATLGICQLFYSVYTHVKRDGKIIVDEAADSWRISITTNPEEIKKKKCIKLDVEKI